MFKKNVCRASFMTDAHEPEIWDCFLTILLTAAFFQAWVVSGCAPHLYDKPIRPWHEAARGGIKEPLLSRYVCKFTKTKRRKKNSLILSAFKNAPCTFSIFPAAALSAVSAAPPVAFNSPTPSSAMLFFYYLINPLDRGAEDLVASGRRAGWEVN